MERTTTERLVRQYSDLILRLSYTYLRSTADAEDVCQEVLLKLLWRVQPFESPEHERAWVVRVTANACKDLLRRSQAHPSVPLDEATELAAPEPADETAEMGRVEGVLACVMSLPLAYREAIYLHYYEGYPIKEIARTCGCSESAAAARLSRGRARLRTMLRGDFDELAV